MLFTPRVRRTTSTRLLLGPVLGLSLLTGVLPARALSAPHEDDPKLLDRVAPYAGPGWRPGAPAALSSAFVGGVDSVPPVEFQADGVELLSWISLNELDAISGNDCWGYVSPSGREYALIGLSNGTTVVEVTNPSFPQIVTKIPGMNSLWRDIKTYGEYAYSVNEGGDGIQVIDLSQVDQGIVTLANQVTSVGTHATHNVAIDETSGFLYRCGGGNNGLRIYSLANPAAPTFVRSWSNIYVHDVQVVTYTSGPFAGRQVAYACGGFSGGQADTRLEILDVTNKNNIFLLSRVTWPNRQYGHQVWLSPDRQYAYVNDELDEGPLPTTTYVVDVSDPNNAFLASTFTNGKRAIGHNLYTKGDLIFEANYKSGLRIFDATDPLNIFETRYFDTWPSNDVGGFNGMWSNYPYLPSGITLCSDLEKGLFVLWPEDPLVAIDYPGGVPVTLDPDGDRVSVQLTERSPGVLEAGSGTLHIRNGAGFTAIPLADLGGGAFGADFPALECRQEVEWFVSARSTNGVTWRSPLGAPRTTHLSFTGNGSITRFEDDAEQDLGWMYGDQYDTATNGTWERTNAPGGPGAPNDDHSPVGNMCFHTAAQGDVDNGRTTLVTPLLDLSGMENPRIDYWRWYSRELSSLSNNERMRIEISNNDGAGWSLVEVVGLEDSFETLIGWFHHGFFVRDLLEPTDQMRMRFRVKDLNQPGTIEAALDDFRVIDVLCDCPAPVNVCVTSPNSSGPGAVLGSQGSTSVSDADLTLTVEGATPGGTGLFYYGGTTLQTPFGDGFRCVGGATKRLFPILGLDGTGSGSYALDFASPPVGSGPLQITPGSSWTFQFWYRDAAAGGSGFNLSDALRATFCQ